MKPNKIIATLAFVMLSSLTWSQQVIYVDISKGNVSITGSKFTGYKWKDGAWKSVSETSQTQAIYHIMMDPNNQFNGTPESIPQYQPVTTTNGGTVNIVNATDVDAVITNWRTRANAINHPRTENRIHTDCSVGLTIVLDNIWSDFVSTAGQDADAASLSFDPNSSGAQLQVVLKGDNRLNKVLYRTVDQTKSKIIFNDIVIAEDANVGGVPEYYNQHFNGTLTVADKKTDPEKVRDGDPTSYYNFYNSAIGGTDTEPNSRGIVIKGGTIFAGTTPMDCCTAIGGGGNGVGGVTIYGGTVTAVTSSTGCAIGGGIGWTSTGGEATVTISGGTIYAYNHGIVRDYAGSGLTYVPAAAIGGGSSFKEQCRPSTITISGGAVYAQSFGGVAIGGGGSDTASGGKATITISGGEVTAKSIGGVLDGMNVPAGSSIGGGIGGKSGNGGDCILTISGANTRLLTGSVGGGSTKKVGGKIGFAQVALENGFVQGQFVMAQGGSTGCQFHMSGGKIDNSHAAENGFVFVKPDGGALWMDDNKGDAWVHNATIMNCSAEKGGAIYMNGGTFELENGVLSGNKASNDGGALYISGGSVNYKSGTVIGNKAPSGNGGGAYVAGGTVNFRNANITSNSALNGGGLFLASGAKMTFYGGIISANEALKKSSAVSKTAYHGEPSVEGPIEGFGGGIYMQNGDSSHKTTLAFDFTGSTSNTFGLYTNTAKTAGEEIVSEGGNTSVVLPAISEMQLIGFEGIDANPYWYQDYQEDDSQYDKEHAISDHHAVQNFVTHVDRYSKILGYHGTEYVEHQIPEGILGEIGSNYLCVTLGFNMLNIILSADGLSGQESALFKLTRHGLSGDKTYEILLIPTANGTRSSRVLKNMPWGVYSIEPNDAWNWTYEKVAPIDKVRVGNTSSYEFVFDMHHKQDASIPQHDERQPGGASDDLKVIGGFYNGSTNL